MAHTLFTPREAASAVIATLRAQTNLPRTVRMDFSNEFVAGRGSTVDVKKAVTTSANVRTAANAASRTELTFSDLSQTTVPVTLDNVAYSAVRLPDAWASMTLENFARDVLVPQAGAVADLLPNPLVTAMTSIKATPADNPKGGGVDYNNAAALGFKRDGSNALTVINRMARVLSSRKVPMVGRTLAVGSAVAEIIRNVPTLVAVDSSGSVDVLRNNTIGRLRGFDVIEDLYLPEDFAVAYETDAFAFVTRTMALPQGAAYKTTISQDGFALRHVMQYDAAHMEDQSVVDALFAAAVLDPDRATSAGISAK